MTTDELIKENNKKRELLTKENKTYYEDMLVYIRLSYDKSEQETEEVLAEMLDHLLIAQEEGKTAEDVFGKKPKAYADEIVGALPKMITKEQLSLMFMGIFYFLAVAVGFSGIVGTFTHYVFNVGPLNETFYLGSESVKLLVSVIIALIFLIITLEFLKWTTFKQINKIKEFLIMWLIGVLSFGAFFLLIYFMPNFGPTVEMPIYTKIIIGAVFYLIGYLIYKRR